MVARRGEIWWAALPDAAGAGPGFRRPVIIVQSNPFNESRIDTVIVAVVTSNLRLAAAPGNIRISKADSGLPKSSVVNVSQLLSLDRKFLKAKVKALNPSILRHIDDGLRLVLAL